MPPSGPTSKRKTIASDDSELDDQLDVTSDDDMGTSAPRTPSSRRRKAFRIALDEDSDEDAQRTSDEEAATALEDDDDLQDQLHEDEADDDADFNAPGSSKRKTGRVSKPSGSTSASASRKPSRTSARGSTISETANTPPPAATKKTLKVKLTRTPLAAAKKQSDPTPTPPPAANARGKQQSKAAPGKRGQATGKAQSKGRSSRGGKPSYSDEEQIDFDALESDQDLLLGRQDDDGEPEDDDELEDDELNMSRAITIEPEEDDDSQEQRSDLGASSGDESEPDEATTAEMMLLAGRTARQLARDSGVEAASHVELPMFDPNRKKKLTDNELALRRSETARKRKNQTEKKLEDDKVETINRLLKKQVGRSRNKLPRAGSAEESDEEAEKAKQKGREQVSRKALKHMPAPFFRTVERVDFKVLAVPAGPPNVAEFLPCNYQNLDRALIQEIDATSTDKAALRLQVQKAEFDEEQLLENSWGAEGLYEYKLRKALGQSRKQWIGPRVAPSLVETSKQASEFGTPIATPDSSQQG